MHYAIRDFRPSDAFAVNAVALAAFSEYRAAYNDWSAFSQNVGRMASLAEYGELVVATVADRIVGAVVYVGPGRPKAAFFPSEWPVLRMLVTRPAYQGRGIGRALTHECICKAERDAAPLIALHTSPIMQIALSMYERMGFRFEGDAPPIHGVPYAIYAKRLALNNALEQTRDA